MAYEKRKEHTILVEATAPSRISLLGSGTDLPSYADKYGGMVLNIAINLRTHIRLYTEDNLHDISGNYLPHTADPELFYAIRDEFNLNSMHFSLFDSRFDGFIKSGLGSSASAAVALIGACCKATGREMSKQEIAELAWKIEVKKLGWYGGRQDQYAAVYGGGNMFAFEGKSREVYECDRERIEQLCEHLQLFYIGGARNSSTIQKGFQKPTDEQLSKLAYIRELVTPGLDAIEDGDFKTLGGYINHTWLLKRASNEGVTNDRVDQIYELAMNNKAWGAKLCGAGQSGYFLTISAKKNKERIEKALLKENIEKVDFEPDFQGLSCRIL